MQIKPPMQLLVQRCEKQSLQTIKSEFFSRPPVNLAPYIPGAQVIMMPEHKKGEDTPSSILRKQNKQTVGSNDLLPKSLSATLSGKGGTASRRTISRHTKWMIPYPKPHAERVGETLAVALIQGGGKPRPYTFRPLSHK